MAGDLTLVVRTAHRAYAIRRNDILELRLVSSDGIVTVDDRPCEHVELCQLLDPNDSNDGRRRRALVVPLRRRLVALLVDEVEALEESVFNVPLPPLLQSRLRQPWAVGALLVGDELIVQIDVRAVAMSYVVQHQRATGG
jgi:chemotaxis protein histidine kinase CheA